MTRRPYPYRYGPLLQRDVDVRGSLVHVGDEGGAARAVVVTGPTEDGNRQVGRLLGSEALQAQRPLRELGLDIAEALAADDGADTAIEAGVVAGQPVPETEAVAVVRLALREETGLLLRGRDEMQRLRGRGG